MCMKTLRSDSFAQSASHVRPLYLNLVSSRTVFNFLFCKKKIKNTRNDNKLKKTFVCPTFNQLCETK